MARKKLQPPVAPTSPPPPPPRDRKKLYVGAAAFGIVMILAAGWLFLRPRPAAPPSMIILVTIDTLRADAVSYSGATNVRTPFLDRLAREGVVFQNAHAHNVVTLPSHANILTGLYPYQHGVRENAGFNLDPKHRTVAAILKEAGYATGAFISAFPLDARFGLNAGFDVYDDRYREESAPVEFTIQERKASDTFAAAAEWLRSSPAEKTFLWVHLYEPHAPYLPQPPFDREYASAPYLGEVATADRELERFLAPVLESHPDALVIVTSDHGEALGDHGELTHGLFTYESTLKVPLIVRRPGPIEPGKDDRYVRHIDIVPTILEQAGLTAPEGLPGRSLLDRSFSGDTYFEALSASLNRGWAPLVGLIHDGRKYIDLPLPELYQLESDPAEKKNLYSEDRRTVHALRKLLAEAAPSAASVERGNVGAEEQAKLLSLGYLAGTAASKKTYTAEDDPKNLIDIDEKLHKVVSLYQTGRLDEAATVAREILERRPDMEIAVAMLAFVLQQREKPDEAIQALRAAMQSGTATDAMKARLGMMLSENGRAEEAIELLRPLSATRDPAILNAYGIALADTGHLDDALAQFQRILAIDQNNARAYENLGIVTLRAGQAANAERYLRKALELNDELPLSLNTLGVIYASGGRNDEAIRLWTQAVSIDPRQYDTLFNLGIVGRRAGRNDVAARALQQFVDGAPPQRYAKDIAAAKELLRELRQ
jgi:choline-sulfatase